MFTADRRGLAIAFDRGFGRPSTGVVDDHVHPIGMALLIDQQLLETLTHWIGGRRLIRVLERAGFAFDVEKRAAKLGELDRARRLVFKRRCDHQPFKDIGAFVRTVRRQQLQPRKGLGAKGCGLGCRGKHFDRFVGRLVVDQTVAIFFRPHSTALVSSCAANTSANWRRKSASRSSVRPRRS